MRCPHCKAENDANAVFCKSCDAWIFGPVYIDKNYTRARKKHLLRWLLPVIACVLVLATCMTLFLWPEPPEASMPVVETPSFSTTTAPATTTPTTTAPIAPTEPPMPEAVTPYLRVLRKGSSRLAFLTGNTILDTDLTVTGVYKTYDFTTNWDHTAAAYRQAFGGNLYYIHNGQLDLIDTGVSDYQFSLDGNGIAWRKDDGSLWYLHTDLESPVHIADTVKQYVISPDGRDIAYVTWESRPYEVTLDTSIYYETYRVLYRYCDGQSTELHATLQDITLLSIANDCLCIYAQTETEIVSLNQSGVVTTLGARIPLIDGSMIFSREYLNADFTQLLYGTEEGTMLSIAGQPGQKISDKFLSPIQSEQVVRYSGITFTYDIAHFEEALYYTISNSFISSVLSPGMDLWYLDDSLTAMPLLENVNNYWLDPSGKTLFCKYIDNQLVCVDLTSQEVTTIAEQAGHFACSYDCTSVYYVSDGVLYVCNISNPEEKRTLAHGSFNELIVSEAGSLYFLQGSDLYVYTGEGSAFLGLSNVKNLNLANNGVLYVEDNIGLYMSTEYGDFEYFGNYHWHATS